MEFSVQTQTHTGLVRQINEDNCLDLSLHGLWVVADGMGGHEAGDFASQLVVDAIGKAVKNLKNKPVTKELLVASLTQANAELIQYSQDYLDGKTAGTTVVVLWLEKNSFHWFWVGDSRGYLLRDNSFYRSTRDHSQVAEWVEQGLMNEEEAEQHACSNIITRAVGVEGELSVDTKSGACLEGDMYLLCTDGLTKEIPDAEIKSYLSQGGVNDGGKAMLHSTLLAGARDNVTFIVVEVTKLDKSELVVKTNENTVPNLFKKEKFIF